VLLPTGQHLGPVDGQRCLVAGGRQIPYSAHLHLRVEDAARLHRP
jgi:hypothetical protein